MAIWTKHEKNPLKTTDPSDGEKICIVLSKESSQEMKCMLFHHKFMVLEDIEVK